jgi:hypothetical protein
MKKQLSAFSCQLSAVSFQLRRTDLAPNVYRPPAVNRVDFGMTAEHRVESHAVGRNNLAQHVAKRSAG